MKILSINIVKDGGHAEAIGLRPHDLIYRTNGSFSDDPQELTNAVSKGNAVLTIIRDYEAFELAVASTSLGVVLGHAEFDEEAFTREQSITAITLSTTPAVPGRLISKTLGLVSSQCILGVGIGTDISAGFRDVLGGRSSGLENQVSQARATVCRDIQEQANKLGATGVVGLTISISDIGDKGGFVIMAHATGTAVKLET